MVVDTGVFIEHVRAKDKSRTTLASIASFQGKYVSVTTVYELLCGANTVEKAAEIDRLLTDFIELAIDRDVATQAAALFIDLRRRNQLIGPLDMLIAATALVHKIPVKTLNINHFERVDGLIIL
jgi:tRNA(fMet)-specific endonuclease VapC